MLLGKLILEGLGLGFLLFLVCAAGIRNGAVGMVHLYDRKVQDRVVALGLVTREKIRRQGVLFRNFCLPGYLIYVLLCAYRINGARAFRRSGIKRFRRSLFNASRKSRAPRRPFAAPGRGRSASKNFLG